MRNTILKKSFKFLFFSMALITLLKPDIISAQIFTKVDVPALEKNAKGFGCGFFDYNNDGKLDIYVTNNASKCQVFRNNGNDSFSEMNIANLIPTADNNSGITIGDYDNDGRNDLFILTMTGTGFLINKTGDSTYQSIKNPFSGISGFLIHCTWADYDNDGLLDMFIPACGNSDFKKNGGIKNYLFNNEGSNGFSRIYDSKPAMTVGNNVSANFCDFDNDGDMDLFMTDCQVNNHLFENKYGEFTEIESETFPNPNSSISCSWGDYDNDGFMDLFVANGLPIEGGSFPNYLYHNNGNKSFTKITTGEIADFRGNSWNGLWADFDNDGDLDLFTGTYSQPDVLFINNGDGTFTRDNNEFDMSSKGTSGASFGDYNNDGFLDLFTANAYGTGHLLYKNNANQNNWVFINCEGTVSNRSAIGAKVKIKATVFGKSFWQIREINGNVGFRSVIDLSAHFGLGDATIIDSLIIEWPSKCRTIKSGIPVNQLHKIKEEIPLNFLNPQFKADVYSGYGSLQVQFKDISIYNELTPITSWSWDFDGDGKEDSNEKNPSYIFNSYEGDMFDITLTISNGTNSATLTRTDLINILPLYQQNIALFQKAEASSVSSRPTTTAANAFDGKLNTYWQSADSTSQWIKVELDSSYSNGKIIINWGTNYAKQFKIQYSDNGTDWLDVISENSGDGNVDSFDVKISNVRYLKILLSNCSNSMGFRINEIEIYRLRAITEITETNSLPKEFTLYQNYPNPFNPETIIGYQIPENALSGGNRIVTLKVYDTLGRELTTLVNEEQGSGIYQVKFNGSSLSSGIYFYRLNAGNFISTKKMILMR